MFDFGENGQIGYFGNILFIIIADLANCSSGHLHIDHKVSYMLNLGARVASGTPGHARNSPSIVTVKVRGFVFKPRFAAQKANQTSWRPQLEAVAVIQKSTGFL